MNCAGYYLWIVHPVPFKNIDTSRGKQQSSWCVAVLSFDSEAASCERVTRIKGMMMGIAHYLRQSHFNAEQVFEQSKPNVPDREIKRVFMWLLVSLSYADYDSNIGNNAQLVWRGWMSIPAHQELICAPVCRNSTCHLHNPVNEGIETFKRCEMLINCPARRWLHKQHDNFNCSFLYKNVRWKEGGGGNENHTFHP